MRKTVLYIALLLNVLLLAAAVLVVQRMGGWRYAWYRLQHPEAGLYASRRSLFAQMPDHPGAVVMLGDSQIEQGEWHELLPDSIPVLNRGITGDHVAGVLARVPDVVRNQPSMVVLCVGVNDLWAGKSVSDITALYRDLLTALRHGAPDAVIMPVSVLPVNNTIRPTGLKNTNIQALNTAIAALARDMALPYLDLYTQLTDAQGNLRRECTDDGVHLNGLGYVIWRKNLN